jgi:hypothetical protein
MQYGEIQRREHEEEKNEILTESEEERQTWIV